MTNYEKIEWLHFAISEAINGNIGELSNALEIVEQLREPYLKEMDNVKLSTVKIVSNKPC